MSLIATLTLNPAIDVSTSTALVEPVAKLRCAAGRRDPGGGGINVARVIRRLGGEALAIYPAGGFMGQLLHQLVEREGIRSLVVPVREETREDFSVQDETIGQQYRFVLPGPRLQDDEWTACLQALADLDRKPDFVCASGSLPPGAPTDFYARVAEAAASSGAKLAVDTSGAPLKAALRARIHLIKPNLRELSEVAGGALDDEASRLAACRTLIEQGRAELIALTLAHEGALLVSAEGAWRAPGLPLTPVSTVGAGDSFLAAMVWALAEGMRLEDALRHGMAAGSAALLAAGTELAHAEDVRRLLPQVTVEPVAEPTKRNLSARGGP